MLPLYFILFLIPCTRCVTLITESNSCLRSTCPGHAEPFSSPPGTSNPAFSISDIIRRLPVDDLPRKNQLHSRGTPGKLWKNLHPRATLMRPKNPRQFSEENSRKSKNLQIPQNIGKPRKNRWSSNLLEKHQ